LQDGAKDATGFDTPKNTATQPAASKNREISGSPLGAPSPVSLSLRTQTLRQRRVSNDSDKKAKNGNLYVIARRFALSGLAPKRPAYEAPPKQSPH
jgi:hypothetical protein